MSRRIIVLHEEIEHIMDRLDRIEEAVRIRQKIPEHTFVDNQEFLQIMMWANAQPAYSQVGSKIYYRMDNILKMLNKHYKPKKRAAQCHRPL